MGPYIYSLFIHLNLYNWYKIHLFSIKKNKQTKPSSDGFPLSLLIAHGLHNSNYLYKFRLSLSCCPLPPHFIFISHAHSNRHTQ